MGVENLLVLRAHLPEALALSGFVGPGRHRAALGVHRLHRCPVALLQFVVNGGDAGALIGTEVESLQSHGPG